MISKVKRVFQRILLNKIVQLAVISIIVVTVGEVFGGRMDFLSRVKEKVHLNNNSAVVEQAENKQELAEETEYFDDESIVAPMRKESLKETPREMHTIKLDDVVKSYFQFWYDLYDAYAYPLDDVFKD